LQFGQEYLNAPFLLFFLVEQARNELNSSSLTRSMDNYWRWCIRNEDEREFVGEMSLEVREEKGEWTEEMYVEALERRRKTGSFRVAEAEQEGEEALEAEKYEETAKEEAMAKEEGEGKREREEAETPESKKVRK
jgi:hypothetical protein